MPSKRFLFLVISFLITAIISIAGYLYFTNQKIVLAQTVYSIPANRIITWQGNVGVSQRGGIPARTTICATIDVAIYGNGTTNATNVINNAIINCPNGQTVYLPAGTYRINSKILIPKGKSITLRGAGPGVTTIKSYISGYWSRAIDIGSDPTASFGQFVNPNFCPQTQAPAGYVQNITSGGTKGSISITLTDASFIAIGDQGIINVLNNNDPNQDLWVQATNIGQEGASSGYGFCCSSGATCRSLGQTVEVIGKNGNIITVNPPLYAAYGTMSSPQFSVIKSSDIAKDIGIEDMTIDNGVAPPNGAYTMVHVTAGRNIWMKNLEMSNAASRFIWTRYGSLYNELRDSYLHDSLTFTSSNYGIEMDQWTSGTLIENNIFDKTMTALMFGGSSSGNVAAYNYAHFIKYTVPSTWLQSFASQHASHAWMNLLEGNWGTEVGADQIHGTESHFTVFRNYLRANGEPQDTAKTQSISSFYIEKGSRLHNFIGNVLGYSGFPYVYEANGSNCTNSGTAIYIFGYQYGYMCDNNPTYWDSKSESTTIRHGNYDYVTNSIIWNDGNDHTLPFSYYLTSKPSWWGSQPWPPIGPDVAGYAASIPAKDRFLNVSNPPVTYQCSDGTDNDSDGLTDYPSDPGCSSSTDNDEYNAPVQTFLPEQYIQVEGGQLTSMQTGTSGSDTYIYTTIDNTGSVKFTFDIQTAGQYKLEARVNSSNDGGQNSFFVGLDNELAQGNNLYAYHFPTSTGFIWDEVSKWGNGQTGNPPISEFDPMIWNLTQGTHSFTFYGRESNTWLDQIRLVSATADIVPPSAPQNLQVQ
ncbi:MAG: glycosyl hydrolase family 28-related protein [Patescibacteria group bacterium]